MPYFVVLINNVHKLSEALVNLEKFTYLVSKMLVINSPFLWQTEYLLFFLILLGEKPPENNYKLFLNIFRKLVIQDYLNRILKIFIIKEEYIAYLY